jgi:hypothetical protein
VVGGSAWRERPARRGSPRVRPPVGDVVDRGGEAVERVIGEGGLVPVLVVVDLQIEGVVEGALQVFGSAGEARFDLG